MPWTGGCSLPSHFWVGWSPYRWQKHQAPLQEVGWPRSWAAARSSAKCRQPILALAPAVGGRGLRPVLAPGSAKVPHHKHSRSHRAGASCRVSVVRLRFGAASLRMKSRSVRCVLITSHLSNVAPWAMAAPVFFSSQPVNICEHLWAWFWGMGESWADDQEHKLGSQFSSPLHGA